jgi:hypothetical protein
MRGHVRAFKAATRRRTQKKSRGTQRLAKIHMEIRKAVEADIPNLLPLMRQLAEFEKYADDFAVTEHVLREQGFHRTPPDFHCLIAQDGSDLVGFLVYHCVHLSSEAKPDYQGTLYCRATSQPRCRQTPDESCRQRGSVHRLWHD